jgi:Periplasmic binding protein
MLQSNRMRRGAVAMLVALALLGASCSRDPEEVGSGEDETTLPDGNSDSRLDEGLFGDLGRICEDGDASGATDVGVTDDTIQIGTITDKGFTSRPGLNQEMYDAAVAFAGWCNSLGGINGREVVVEDRDAAMLSFNTEIVEACEADFALVGGGAVLDDSDNGGREACGLPNFPGYVVSAGARDGGLQVQALPNPVGNINIGPYRIIADTDPEVIDRMGIITASFGSVIDVRDDTVAAAEELGYEVVYSGGYDSLGESNWRPFAEAIRDADVQVFDFVGEPTYLGQLLLALDEIDYHPRYIVLNANFYDTLFLETSGAIAENTFVRLQFTPLELADENAATADYLALMEEFNPDGKVALLGMQAMSSLLLWAQSAAACGNELTRECLLDEAGSVTEWTGGGLHALQNPAEQRPGNCFLSMEMTPEAFVVSDELTAANDGIFNCDDANVAALSE